MQNHEKYVHMYSHRSKMACKQYRDSYGRFAKMVPEEKVQRSFRFSLFTGEVLRSLAIDQQRSQAAVIEEALLRYIAVLGLISDS